MRWWVSFDQPGQIRFVTPLIRRLSLLLELVKKLRLRNVKFVGFSENLLGLEDWSGVPPGQHWERHQNALVVWHVRRRVWIVFLFRARVQEQRFAKLDINLQMLAVVSYAENWVVAVYWPFVLSAYPPRSSSSHWAQNMSCYFTLGMLCSSRSWFSERDWLAKLRHSLQPKCDMLLYCRREENNLIADLERESVSRNDRESVLSSECLRLINDRQIAVAIALITDY